MHRVFGPLPIIAEDLGVLTQEVYDLLEKTRFAGMKVLQFAFDSDANNAYLPHNFASPHCVLYTGTHDNDTLQGFLDNAGEEKLAYIDAYCGISQPQLRAWGCWPPACAAPPKYLWRKCRIIFCLAANTA